MSKINGEYKYKYIVIPVIKNDVKQENLLKEAFTNLIKHYVEEINNESNSDTNSSISRDRVKLYAEVVATLMEWKSNMKTLGTDTHIIDLDFYKNGIEKI